MLRIGLILAAVVLVADQVSKWYILYVVGLPQVGHIPLLALGPFGFDLTMVWNRGVTFGMFAESAAGAVWLLVGIKLAVVAWLLLWLRRAASRTEATAIGLIIGGALGNILDRLRIGAVTDFIDAHYGGWHWPTFNMADVAIVCGVTLLVLTSFRAPSPQVQAQ